MPKYLICALALCTSSAFALQLHLNNLNLDYNSGKGAMSMSEVKFESEHVGLSARDYHFDLEQTETGMEFKNYNHDVRFYKLEDLLTNIKDIHQISFQGVQLKLDQSLSLDTPLFDIYYDNTKIGIQQLTLNCNKVELNPIPGCLNQASVTAKQLHLPNIFSFSLAEALLEGETVPEGFDLKSYRPKITNIKLGLNKNIFTGTAVMKLLFNIQFQLAGRIDVDIEKKLITLSRVSVKKGIIPVTKVVLLALAKLNIKGVRIVGNSIIIQI